MLNHTNGLKNSLAHRYRIERELGEGGMASVYLAHDLKQYPKVALKVLKAEIAQTLGCETHCGPCRSTVPC